MAAPILFMGEAIADLVSEDDAGGIQAARCFRPSFGGALANAAVAATRAGAQAELAAGVGDDDLGTWLERVLEHEGVGRRWFTRVVGLQTPLAVIGFDERREPVFAVYGGGIEAGLVAAVGDRLGEAIEACGAVVVGSNTLVGEHERALTFEACRLAREHGREVVFDPNLRAGRWAGLELARSLALEVCALATVVRANIAEARWLLGGEHDLDSGTDPATAARALADLGPTLAVVTCSGAGVYSAGAVEDAWESPGVELVTPLGAGDCFTGTLAAGLAAGGWQMHLAAEAIAAAEAAAARTCEYREAVPPR